MTLYDKNLVIAMRAKDVMLALVELLLITCKNGCNKATVSNVLISWP
jgi:hypothetical protein